MRIVFRYLFVAALVLSTCAMRAGAAHAEAPIAEQDQLRAAEGARWGGRMAIARMPGTVEIEVRGTLERGGARSRRS